jgi:hypothetical protein
VAVVLGIAGGGVDALGAPHALAYQGLTTEQDLQAALVSACSSAGRLTLGLSGSCTIRSLQRRDVVPSARVVAYEAIVQVGPDPSRDIIGLHRVVKELAPWVPIATPASLMMVHGDAWPFTGAFFDAPDRGTAPVFFAQHDIDVWGIDLRWTQVPTTTTSFDFMQHWGLDTDRQDLGMALSIARAARHYTGSGFSQMLLLGWSRGGQLGYTYLGTETARPPSQRHVSGFIPVDVYLKVPPNSPRRAEACARIHDPISGNLVAYNAGVFVSTGGALLREVGALATTQPDTPNPFFPPGHPFAGYTNKQVGLGGGAATFQLLFNPPVPHYHFTAGQLGPGGVPLRLIHVASDQRWFDVLQRAAPFEPLKVLLDADAIICDDGSSSLDEQLTRIAVPVVYVGAAGGFGTSGLYTMSLLASSDRSSIIRSLMPLDPLRDVGHFDIWLGANARDLWWEPMLSWIQDHGP